MNKELYDTPKVGSLTERFWRWIYSVSVARIKEAYLERTGWDLKCPNCNGWSSVCGIELESRNDEQTRYRCGQCLELTAWHFDGPVAWPVPIEYFGKESA